MSNKATRRIERAGDTAMLLREKYTRRIAAIRKFTDRLGKGNLPDEAELESLRRVGVSEDEIRALVRQYRT